MRRSCTGVIVALLMISMLGLRINRMLVKTEPDTIYVDDDGLEDYVTIQEAVNAANPGDVIYVYNGTYFEHVIVNKTVSVIGENPATTIIDGEGASLLIVSIVASESVFENFTVQNTTSTQEAWGISVFNNRDVTLRGNIVKECWFGVLLTNSSSCGILENRVVNNYQEGIYLRDGSSNNSVIGNSVLYNPTGIYVTGSSQYNVFYRNNIIDNEVQVFPALGSHTLWNNGVEGNYWNCYEGIDLNGDGIGDTELPHLVDNRPLMEPWSRTRNYAIGSHKICVDCNCTIASFTFNQSQRQVSFLIIGPTGWNDSCEVTIPKELLAPNETALEMWIVMFGSSPLSDVTIIQNNFTRISLDYILGSSTSENRVRLKVSAFSLYPPTAGFAYTPSIASTIQPVNFTELSEESPNGTIIIRRWDFGDGNITTSNRKWLLHCYNRTGLFNVTFTVKDDNDLTDSITKSILVLNIAPVANFTFTPSEPCVGEEVTFDASSSIDPDGGIVGYFWSFGDGTTSENEAITTHTFKHVKSPESHYKVTLTVRDDDEANSSSAELVFVSKGLTMIQVDSPTTVKAEEYFILNVTLRDCASLPLSGKQIYIYDDDKYVSDENTGSEGAVRANISLSIAGEHVIRAEYKGSLDYSGSNDTTTVTVTPLNTTLTVVAPENVTQSEEFTIFAVLNSENETSVSNAPVEFYLHNGSSWESIGSSLTNQSGVASLSCTLQQVGAFILKAEFEGSGIYAASNSTEHSLTVVASEGGYFPHFAAVVVLVVIICVAFAALRIRRNLKRPRE